MNARCGRGARRALAVAIVTAGGSLGACAPPPPLVPALPVGDVTARYHVALAARERRSVAVEADVALWMRLAGRGRLPGVQGELRLAAPDAIRLHIGSTFGTAMDLAARGDSVTLYVPSRHAFARLDAASDSLGWGRPGARLLSLWSGDWRAPSGAFDHGEIEGAFHVARWADGDDSLALAVDSRGLPAWVKLSGPGGALRVDYAEWGGWDGVKWPARIEVSDAEGEFHLTSRTQRVRFPARAEAAAMVVRLPADARRQPWLEVRRAIER